MAIDLTDEDKDNLRSVLEKHLTELSWEIAFTHSRDSLQFLRRKRDFIESFIRRLDG